VFSETQDYTEWLFIRPLFFWIARSLAGVLGHVGFAEGRVITKQTASIKDLWVSRHALERVIANTQRRRPISLMS
jgi:hypothetical protein